MENMKMKDSYEMNMDELEQVAGGMMSLDEAQTEQLVDLFEKLGIDLLSKYNYDFAVLSSIGTCIGTAQAGNLDECFSTYSELKTNYPNSTKYQPIDMIFSILNRNFGPMFQS